MDTYEELVNKNFKEKSSALIYNRTREHAKTLVLKLIKEANKCIKLYAGGQDIDFYKDDKIKELMNNKSKDFMFQCILDDGKNIDQFKEIFSSDNFLLIKDDVQPFYILLPPQIGDNEFQEIKHFMISGAESFRVEKRHDSNSTSLVAVACAYNPQINNVLNSAFDILTTDFCK